MRDLLLATFRAALDAADPARLTARHLGDWTGPAPARVLAFGKAAGPMLEAALTRFPGTPGLGVLPDGAALPPGLEDASQVQVIRAAHPAPDHRSVQAGAAALAEATRLHPGEAWLVLVSGGGSALLSRPEGVSLAAKARVARDLMHAGADIRALNAVRAHLSGVKGGRLAQAAAERGAAVHALLLSDVVGDDPAVIASGPTVPNGSTFADAWAVLDAYGVDAPEVARHLARGLRGEVPDLPSELPGVSWEVIGLNRLLLDAAAAHLRGLGFEVLDLGDRWTGEAREVAARHAQVLREQGPSGSPLAVLSGGETTVTVRGAGVGGRNHEFALALATELGEPGVWGLSAGSDGMDGGTGAAGALLTPDTLTRAAALNLDPADHLRLNDSGSFFAALGDQVHTGPTGQNLNDLRVLLSEPGSS